MFKGIIFDMDGVILDATEWHYEALNEALSPFGYEISREEHHNGELGYAFVTYISKF